MFFLPVITLAVASTATPAPHTVLVHSATPAPSSTAAASPVVPHSAAGAAGVGGSGIKSTASGSAPGVSEPSPLPRVTPKEAPGLVREFQRAQATESQALRHRQKLEMDQLKVAQRAKVKEHREKERQQRKVFFEQNKDHKARKSYVEKVIEQEKELRSQLDQEMKKAQKDQDLARQGLKAEQERRLKEFKSLVDQGERPPLHLWPAVN